MCLCILEAEERKFCHLEKQAHFHYHFVCMSVSHTFCRPSTLGDTTAVWNICIICFMHVMDKTNSYATFIDTFTNCRYDVKYSGRFSFSIQIPGVVISWNVARRVWNRHDCNFGSSHSNRNWICFLSYFFFTSKSLFQDHFLNMTFQ